jgi:LPS export ABC transporter protein LptC
MTLKNKHLLQLILVIIASVFVACTSATDKEAEAKEVEIIDFSKMPSMVGDSVHTLVSDSGRLTYRMQTPNLAIYDKAEAPYWDFPQGIHMTTYNKDGDVDGDIRSKLAIYDVEKKLWTLTFNVVALNPDGTRLETELLYWDQTKELIYSDTLVKIVEDGMVTLGSGFESDQSFQDWHMDNFSTEFIMDE